MKEVLIIKDDDVFEIDLIRGFFCLLFLPTAVERPCLNTHELVCGATEVNDRVRTLGLDWPEKNPHEHIRCPALYRQYDILDFRIVRHIIRPCEWRIVDTVGLSI